LGAKARRRRSNDRAERLYKELALAIIQRRAVFESQGDDRRRQGTIRVLAPRPTGRREANLNIAVGNATATRDHHVTVSGNEGHGHY
jgi:hypothetical protein